MAEPATADPGAAPWRRAGWVLAAAALAGLVAVPLLELVAAAVAQGLPAVRGAFGPRTVAAVRATLGTSVAVTVLAVAIGAACALVTERLAIPGRRWVRLALLLPIVVPPFVTALSWGQAFGAGGLLDDLVGVTLPGLYGPLGVIAVLTVETVPLAYLVVAAGLATRSEPDLERAARASGASPVEVLATVTLPLLRPSLVAAGALAFVGSANSFGVPAVLGSPAGFRTVTTQLYADLAFAADPAAFARVLTLSTGLVVLALCAVGVADTGQALGATTTRTGLPAGGVVAGRRTVWPAAAVLLFVAVTTGLPLLAVVAVALTRAVGLAPVPANWSLANFAEALTGARADALGRTLVLAVGAATASVLLGALVTALRRSRTGRVLGTGAILTFAVPGSALAVAVLLAYGPWLRDTLLLIGVAYVAKFWALGHRTVVGAADALPADCMRASRSSGAGPVVALRTIVVPMLAPALVAAWLLVVLFGLHELTVSSLLYGPGSETLAVVVLNLQQLGDTGATSALAVLLTAAVLAVGAVFAAVTRRARR